MGIAALIITAFYLASGKRPVSFRSLASGDEILALDLLITGVQVTMSRKARDGGRWNGRQTYFRSALRECALGLFGRVNGEQGTRRIVVRLGSHG